MPTHVSSVYHTKSSASTTRIERARVAAFPAAFREVGCGMRIAHHCTLRPALSTLAAFWPNMSKNGIVLWLDPQVFHPLLASHI